MRVRLRSGCAALLIAALPASVLAGDDAAARCAAVRARQHVAVTLAASRAAQRCVRAATDAAACLGDDLTARVAAAVRRLERAEARWCAAASSARLAASSAIDAAAIASAARVGVVGLLEDLLGDDLAALTAGAGGRCQEAVAGAVGRLHRTLWVETWRNGRAGGVDAGTDVIAALASDPVVGRAARAVGVAVRRSCASVPALDALFRLRCAEDATTADGFARCAVAAAHARFYRGLAATTALTIPCDLQDDGAADLSCVPPALEEHVLNRLGYGPNAWSLGRLRALGVPGYVAEQLHPETIPDDDVDAVLTGFPSLTMNFLDLRVQYPNRVVPGLPQSGDVLKELQRAKVLRAIASHRQLEQVLTDVWFNHFNILATDRRDYDISPYERLAIRPHVLGRFRDLLLAVARSPGMGDYLDARRNRLRALNENFARELLELHTVGAASGFTEADVHAVARAFTGWKENQAAADGFEFVAAWHDRDPKTVLGLALPANGGYEEGVAVLDHLAAHPATAARVARKLIVRFVAETPPPALLAAATQTYLATDGDLRAVMETILSSAEFLADPANRRAKVKRPLHLMASLARATGADPATLDLDRIRRRVRELGEDLYGFAAPPGYPDVSPAWSGPGTMLLRFNFIELASRGIDGIVPVLPPGNGSATALVDALVARLVPAGASAETRDTAVAFVDLYGSAGQPGRAAAAAAVLLSSPEFLLH